MRTFLIAAGLACLLVLAICAGCTSSSTPSYSVDSNGILSVTCAPVTTSETVLFTNETYTESQIILHTQTGDVTTYLSYPKDPKAVLLYLPGAGEKISGHAERMVTYAADGYAFMFLDYRGRGGETAGYPFNPNTDYALFENKEWPEYYLTICDVSSAQAMLSTRFGVPVYAVGGSNGGRYAAVASRRRQELCRVHRDLHCGLGGQRVSHRTGGIGRHPPVCRITRTQHLPADDLPAPGLDVPQRDRPDHPICRWTGPLCDCQPAQDLHRV